MREFGVVVGIVDDKAIVNVKRQSACGKCKACEMGKSDQKEINITAKNTVGAKLNDSVNLIMDTPDVLRAAIIVYLIPLCALLAGIAIPALITSSMGIDGETISIVSGLVLMSLSYLFVRRKDKDLEATKKYEPEITEILGHNII